ncbi:ABC transporter ATP-binding protein [Halalkalibacter lacteus]|uniref:ABC transporter ATP-binding protein n=1 Tax=Halalkalibacter lacteus TaxID=3090663 RepID=UPI002FCAD24F
MSTNIKPLLNIEQLEISYYEATKLRPVIHDVSFQLYSAETVALTGPSGCGKSVTSQAIVGLLETGFEITSGHILYKEENILYYEDSDWQKLRREEIALLIQDSLNGLNPIRTVKKQMIETIKQKKKWLKKDIELYLHSLLSQVGFTDPKHILSSYPFELSGGMRQRVLLAMMLSLRPKILIADEPTTALDVINRDKVLSLLKKLQHDFELTILLISHDQSINRFADRVVQMRQGTIVI